MTRGLLDTSVCIARESRGLDPAGRPDELAVSIVSPAQLSAGLLAATDLEIRTRRLVRLTAVIEMNPIPIGLAIVEAWARIRVQLAHARRRVNVDNRWIAATALALSVPVGTQTVTST